MTAQVRGEIQVRAECRLQRVVKHPLVASARNLFAPMHMERRGQVSRLRSISSGRTSQS